jgi:hypothetical protein
MMAELPHAAHQRQVRHVRRIAVEQDEVGPHPLRGGERLGGGVGPGGDRRHRRRVHRRHQGPRAAVAASQGTFNAAGVYAATVILSVVALLAEGLLTFLENRLFRWRPAEPGPDR